MDLLCQWVVERSRGDPWICYVNGLYSAVVVTHGLVMSMGCRAQSWLPMDLLCQWVVERSRGDPWISHVNGL